VNRLLFLGLAGIWLAAGCSMMSTPAAEQPTAIPTLVSALPVIQDPALTPLPVLGGKQSGDLIVWISSNPNPPVRGDNVFEALVTDASGQPMSDAAISFDLNMVNMNHGRNVVAASALGNGRYRGVVHFLMPGPWRVIVGIERAGQMSTVRFDFTVNW
jgi:hypothetical protein